MTAITASLVKELREQTGAGMMDCKRALEETGGDVDAARKLLRERGVAQVGKRAGRATTEGKVATRTKGSVASMVAVGCETEPVSNNDEFLVFVQRALDAVEQDGPEGLDQLEDDRVELAAKLGENVVLRGGVRFEGEDGDVFADYVHPPAQKIGVLVRGRGSADAARPLAMHIAFAGPRFASRDEVPEAEIAAEREILERQPDVAEKPEQVRGKMVEGRLQKWFAEAVLVDQAWIHEPSTTVGRALAEQGFELVEFARLALAE